MSRILFILISLLLVNLCIAKEPVQRNKEKLPPLVKSFEIIDKNSESTSFKKRLDVVISPRLNSDGVTYWIPISIAQAAQELEAMLPAEYYKLLMSRYVKINVNNVKYDDSTVLLFYDELSQYLYSVWDIPESKLGEQFYCIGILERDLSVFLVVAASMYAEKNGTFLREEYSNNLEMFLDYKDKCEKKGDN
ncbi:MAG: hypothetical protein Q9M92_06455 [Enterobacterales bacterium]|nr:hypothetical protein [Enterobacterales bacterium]